VLVHVTQPEHIGLVRELLEAHAFWSSHGLGTDLVVFNDYPGSYLDALQDQLVSLLNAALRPIEQTGAVFLLRAAQLPQEDKNLFEAAATVVLHGEHGPLARQWKSPRHPLEADQPPPLLEGRRPRDPIAMRADNRRDADQLDFWNGVGGFAGDGKEYHILLSAGQTTPQPWSNVIANPDFGTLVTESGAGYTWFGNSRENKLTTWSNDPVTDSPSEALYIRDEASGTVWSPLPAILRDEGDYRIQHGQGYSRFRHEVEGIDHEVTISLAVEDPIKFIRIRLHNRAERPRQLSLTYAVQWVLGVARQETQLHLQTEIDPATGALLARNPYHPEFGEQVAFLQVLANQRSLTGDRREFLGRNRDWQRPAALERLQLSDHTGPGLDPIGAVQTKFQIPPRGEVEVVFLLGAGRNQVQCERLLRKYSDSVQVGLACCVAPGLVTSRITRARGFSAGSRVVS
jgi:cyclic beta-1,2-glucan synthetase